MRRLILTIVAVLCLNFSVSAQFDPQFSQNVNCVAALNASMMSMDGKAKALALYRNQWMGLEGNPRTFFAEVYAPFKFGQNNHVFGLRFMNDAIGLFSNNSMNLQYAFKKKLKAGELSFGIEVGGLFVSFDGSDVFIPDKGDYHTQPSDDVVIPTGGENNGFGFDVAVGVSYYDERKYIGLSFQHLPGSTISLSDYTEVKVRQLVYLLGGYSFPLNQMLTFQPSVCLKSDFASWQLDVNLLLEYKKIYGGLSYRYQDAVVLMVGVKNFKKLDIGFSYDITTNKLITVSSGTIEVTAAYSFNLDFDKKKKYKSIRIL